ncbi:MAG: serine/threonine-protein kinase, partial [bacterium]
MDKSDLAEIGKYKILGQIGEGAMGVVYRALDPVLNRAVAIKVMSDSLARDADLRSRFLREAQSAGSLQHPNVITIYDFGEVDGHPFIAMEFVEGSDLNELIANKSPMTLIEKLDVLIDVLNGLSYAHKRGIVHRDIKPANIRIDEDGRARVMDFGIAHLNSSNMTRTGVMVGTPAYMCPEQITGGEISPASDLFAVGAVMYELLTGVQAFRGESLQTVMYKIVSAPTPDIKLSATGLSPERNAVVTRALNTIVAKALEKEVPLRYHSAVDMAADLSDVRTRLIDVNDPIRTTSLRATVAKAMANTEEIKLRRRRNRLAGTGVGAVLVVALGWAALSWSRRRTDGTAAIPDLPPTIATQPATQPQNPVAAIKTPAPAPTPPSVAAPSVATAAKAAASATPTARELAVFRSLQSTALEARRRAADAGATPENLGAGDGHNK